MNTIIESYFYETDRLKSGSTLCKDEIKQLKVLTEERNITFVSQFREPEKKSFILFFGGWEEGFKMCFLASTKDKKTFKIFCTDRNSSYHPMTLDAFKTFYHDPKTCPLKVKTYFDNLFPDT